MTGLSFLIERLAKERSCCKQFKELKCMLSTNQNGMIYWKIKQPVIINGIETSPTSTVMSTISKRKRTKASIIAFCSISNKMNQFSFKNFLLKRNELIYSLIWQYLSKPNIILNRQRSLMKIFACHEMKWKHVFKVTFYSPSGRIIK